jgi:hypothetical protein
MRVWLSASVFAMSQFSYVSIVMAQNSVPDNSSICFGHVPVTESGSTILYGKDIGGSVGAIIRNFGPNTVRANVDNVEIPVGGKVLVVPRRSDQGHDSVTTLALSTDKGAHACVDIDYLFDSAPSITPARNPART